MFEIPKIEMRYWLSNVSFSGLEGLFGYYEYDAKHARQDMQRFVILIRELQNPDGREL
jgi:hypothetical protein